MAKIENNKNNNPKKSGKSLSEQVGKKVSNLEDKVEKTLDDAKHLLKDAVQHPVDTAKEFGTQAVQDVISYTWWAKLLLVLFWSILGLIILIFVSINLPVTKRYVANQAIQLLNSDFKAKMSTQNVDVNLFGVVHIQGLKIQDDKGLNFIKIRDFTASSDWFSIISNPNDIKFRSLTLSNADIKVVTYKGDSEANFIKFIDKFSSGNKKTTGVFQMNTRLYILDSKVSIINQNHEGDAGKWLIADHVNLKVPTLKVNGANVSAQINNFSFNTKRWGKVNKVETFSTQFSLTKKSLILKDLTFNTEHSLLMGDIIFNLNPKTGWQDFADKVRLEFNLKKGSQLSGYDLSYFATNWDNYKPFQFLEK